MRVASAAAGPPDGMPAALPWKTRASARADEISRSSKPSPLTSPPPATSYPMPLVASPTRVVEGAVPMPVALPW